MQPLFVTEEHYDGCPPTSRQHSSWEEEEKFLCLIPVGEELIPCPDLFEPLWIIHPTKPVLAICLTESVDRHCRSGSLRHTVYCVIQHAVSSLATAITIGSTHCGYPQRMARLSWPSVSCDTIVRLHKVI